jgi:hypothetical protein
MRLFIDDHVIEIVKSYIVKERKKFEFQNLASKNTKTPAKKTLKRSRRLLANSSKMYHLLELKTKPLYIFLKTMY